MGRPGMRITVDAAMRAREVSRPRPDGEEPSPSRAGTAPDSEPGSDTTDGTTDGSANGNGARRGGRAAKNERRRLDKRGARGKPSL